MDGIIEGLAKAAATNFKPKEGDYIKDGLLYCGKCHTPKQCEVEMMVLHTARKLFEMPRRVREMVRLQTLS